MSENIYTIAILRAKAGRFDDLRSTLETLAAKTRKESGAIEYFFVQDQNHDSNTIVSYEKWEDADEEAKHWKTSHLRDAIRRMKDILQGEPVVHRGPRII
jgi:quinol monooxygenase YgiN